MSKYTIEIRELVKIHGRDAIEGWFKEWELSDYLTPEEIAVIEERGTWTKDKLARLIVDHYFMREIGFETPALFHMKANTTMREIMERKAPLIYSAAIKYDPLVNVDFTESFVQKENSTGSSSSQTSNTSSGLTVNSDTPQGQISKTEILQGKYASATSAGETTADGSDTTETEGTANRDYTKRVKGNSGVSATAQKMIEQYRDTIIAINSDIIEELEKLFMALY